MIIKRLSNGNLQISADAIKEKRLAKQLLASKTLNGYAQEAAFIAQCLKPAYEQTSPASVSALTSAPIITDGINNWGFMNYQIESFLAILAKGKSTVWTKG